MRNIARILLISTLAAMSSLPILGFSNPADQTEMDLYEKGTLARDVGLTENEIASLNMPEEVLRKLIEQDAKKIGIQFKSVDLPNEGSLNMRSESDIVIQGEGDLEGDIQLAASAFTVASDRPGYKKIYFFASFDWNIDPYFKLVDKMSIGYPTALNFILPMNSSTGKPTQHNNRTCNYYYLDGWTCSNHSVVSDWDPAAGFASEFDLGFGKTDHSGYIEQYVYVHESRSDTANIKIVYGHKRVSGNVSVGIYPAGLAVSSGLTTDTADMGLEISF